MTQAEPTTEPSQAPPAVTDTELNRMRAQAERDRIELEKARLALEQSFAKKWAAPLLGLAGIIIAGSFSLAAVLVAAKFKEIEDQKFQQERTSSATEQAKSRQDRLKLDLANFMMSHWPSFLKGSAEDRRAIIIVTGELFPQDVSRNVVDKLAAMTPQDQSVQDAINLLQPRYDLSGEWQCTVKCQSGNRARIQQTSKSLFLRNEVGSGSNGVYKTPYQFSAIEWGDLGGIVQEDGRTISWLNGSVWTKIAAESKVSTVDNAAAFTVYPHYRRSNQSSLDFRQVVRARLAEQGFVVAGDTGDSKVASAAGGGSEGPNVSYFVEPTLSDGDKSKLKAAAQVIADTLNQKLPDGLGPFKLKEHTDILDQSNIIAVWY